MRFPETSLLILLLSRFSCVQLCHPMSCQDPLFQSSGVGRHALLQGDLPNPGIEPWSPALQADSLPLSYQGSPKISLMFPQTTPLHFLCLLWQASFIHIFISTSSIYFSKICFKLKDNCFTTLCWFLLLLLLLSCVSRVQLCATPQTAAQQAPLSLGFSRREHWSGLPFPSPMRESEK